MGRVNEMFKKAHPRGRVVREFEINIQRTAILSRNRDTNIGNSLWMKQGKEGVGQVERVALKHTYYHM